MAKFPRQRSLFGGFAPPPRDPRGRKAIPWMRETAETIVVLAAQKRTQEEIAAHVGLSVKTLARIYADELEQAAARLRQAVFEAQVRRATEKGSTPAAKFVLAELERGERREQHEALSGPAPTPRAPKLGKKEERRAAAETVAGDDIFAPGAPPARLTH